MSLPPPNSLLTTHYSLLTTHYLPLTFSLLAAHLPHPSLEPEPALAPDHEQTGGRNDAGTDEDQHAWHLAEHQKAEEERPQHRGVVERRDQRGRRKPIAFRQQDVRDAAADADDNQRGELGPVRHEPAQRPGRKPRQRADQR